MCSSTNISVGAEVEGSGGEDSYSWSYHGFQVCIRTQGCFQFLHFMDIISILNKLPGIDNDFYIYHIVDCKLSNWEEWSSCSKHCGKGSRSRNRTILVSPENEGQQCGPTFERLDCNENPCTSNKISD